MTINPIIQRELLGLLRTRKAMIIQPAFVAALSLLVWMLWPGESRVNLDGRQAQQVFRVFVYGLLVGLLLLAPVYPATAIVRERQDKTLALLLISRLSPTAILVGKVSAAIGFILLLLVLSIPPAAACYVMGGIDPWQQILPAYAVLALVALQYAMVSLLVSSFARTTDAALRTAYGCVLVLSVLAVIPYSMVRSTVTGVAGDLLSWLAAVSPIPAVMQLAGQDAMFSGAVGGDIDFVGRYLLLAAFAVIVCIVGLSIRLRPTLLDESRSAGKVTDERSQRAQRFRRIMYLWFFDPHRRSSAIGNWTNPVMVKEFRSRAFGRSHWTMRLIATCLIVSLLLTIATTTFSQSIDPQYMGGVLVLFQMGLIGLIAPALSTALISGELESRSWQLLQMTRLCPYQIVLGKLMSVGWTLALLLSATIPGYAVLLLIEQGYRDRVVGVLITLVLMAAFSVLLGAACSALLKKTTAATSAAYGLLVMLCVGTLLPWLAEGMLFSREIVEPVLRWNPVAAGLSIIRMPGLAEYQLVPFNWYMLGVGSVVAAIVLWWRTSQLTRSR